MWFKIYLIICALDLFIYILYAWYVNETIKTKYKGKIRNVEEPLSKQLLSWLCAFVELAINCAVPIWNIIILVILTVGSNECIKQAVEKTEETLKAQGKIWD